MATYHAMLQRQQQYDDVYAARGDGMYMQRDLQRAMGGGGVGIHDGQMMSRSLGMQQLNHMGHGHSNMNGGGEGMMGYMDPNGGMGIIQGSAGGRGQSGLQIGQDMLNGNFAQNFQNMGNGELGGRVPVELLKSQLYNHFG